jgi:deoxyribonuclease-4
MTVLIGSHITGEKSILNSLKKGVEYGGNCSQIFLKSPRSTKFKSKLTEEQMKEIKNYVKKQKLYLVVHASYLLNFCRPLKTKSGEKSIKWAIDSIIEDLNISKSINSSGAVLHVGKSLKLAETEAYANMVDNVVYIINNTTKKIIFLETPAGRGTEIGKTTEKFAYLYNTIKNDKRLNSKNKNRIKICVDTCHIFSAGYSIDTLNGIIQYFKDFNMLIGIEEIALIHLNDSKYKLGSFKDEHKTLQDGYIFKSLEPLKYLIYISNKYKIPMILETHGEFERDISKIKKLNNKLNNKKYSKLNKINNVCNNYIGSSNKK